VAKIELGEAQEVLAHIRTDEAINLQGFCFFATFFSKKKVDNPLESRRLSKKKKTDAKASVFSFIKVNYTIKCNTFKKKEHSY